MNIYVGNLPYSTDRDELREILDAGNYLQYRDFKKRVLTIAVKEINQYSDKTVHMIEHKANQTKTIFMDYLLKKKLHVVDIQKHLSI